MVSKGNPIVVGLTGQFGAGCTTVGEYLKEEGFQYYSLSEIVKASAQKRLGAFEYQELSKKDLRRILQDEGNKLREADARTIAKNVYEQMKAAGHVSEDANVNIVVDSIRNPEEVEFFSAAFKSFFY